MVKIYCTRKAAVLVGLVLIFVISVFGQTKGGSSECESQQTCTKCMQIPKCVWCSERRETSDQAGVVLKPRCMDERDAKGTKTGKPWCAKEMIGTPTPETIVIDNRPFSAKEDNPVQIRPQRFKLSLRPGKAETLKIQYKQAQDYPVDLYFLMDLSATMERHKDNLSKLGIKLANAMKELTSNFHLGFGSFVDKVLLPMTTTQPRWLRGDCKLKNNKPCAQPYGYKHQLTLTHKYEEFKHNVETAPLSGNLDAPEGGLDATMQVMVCGDKIGWRKNARHILVYSADGTYHIAGDGRLAGLVEPNDETCHLNATGFYTHAETLDYPSISQINKQALNNSINMIFAVTQDQRATYEALSKSINGSSVGILDENSEAVVAIVREQYKKLTNKVTMISNAPGNLEVRYFTKCIDKSKKAQLRERNECDGVRVSTPLEFEVEIKFQASECLKPAENRRQIIEIKPQGVNERVIVEVEMLCDCPCSSPSNETYEKNSPTCSGSGDLVCGVCACQEGFFGRKCDCGDNEGRQNTISNGPCTDKEGNVCSGRGSCMCGVCKCEARDDSKEEFSGQYCECDNFSCDTYEGKVCGGPERGECKCGKCVCNQDLEGDACECSTLTSTCSPPGEKASICSGNGDCVCGKCTNCTEGRSGKFCEECPTCPTQLCDQLKDCVECQTYGTGPGCANEETRAKCVNIEFLDPVDDIDEDPKAIHPKGTHVCVEPDSSGCTFVFTYVTEETRGDTSIQTVVAEKEKKCPEPGASIFGAAAGAIGLTLFLGLLGLIIWKLLTSFHDHREWVKFEKERISAKWENGQNPLFKEPTTSFNNPTFGNATKG